MMKKSKTIRNMLKLENLQTDIKHDYVPSRERSLALTKLEEAEMWLSRCAAVESGRDDDEH